ncbi:MAG: hypothetical protein LC725_12010, partial [Lentisphaerae bacterium]|nr:hypothetical protein [Lentisphaerota bacterium]
MSDTGQRKFIRPRRRKLLPVLLVYDLDPDWPAHDIQESLETSQQLKRALQRQGHAVSLLQARDGGLEKLLQPYRPEDWLLFNWCEGLPGIMHSEALAARIIQGMNFVYTGATPEVLEFNWNKHQTKQLLAMENVPTPRWQFYDENSTDGWNCFPAIVKLANEHCSLGVTTESVVMNRHELKRRIRHVQQTYRQPALVEDFIDGREFHVTLWGNE